MSICEMEGHHELLDLLATQRLIDMDEDQADWMKKIYLCVSVLLKSPDHASAVKHLMSRCLVLIQSHDGEMSLALRAAIYISKLCIDVALPEGPEEGFQLLEATLGLWTKHQGMQCN